MLAPERFSKMCSEEVAGAVQRLEGFLRSGQGLALPLVEVQATARTETAAVPPRAADRGLMIAAMRRGGPTRTCSDAGDWAHRDRIVFW